MPTFVFCAVDKVEEPDAAADDAEEVADELDGLEALDGLDEVDDELLVLLDVLLSELHAATRRTALTRRMDARFMR